MALSEKRQTEIKEELRGKILPNLTPIEEDYVDAKHRGTVKFVPSCRNYSFHITRLPDGSTVREMNFTQENPHTVAVLGENLTFINCNLKNVEIHPTWKLIDCLAIHARHRMEGDYLIYEIENKGQFMEVSRELIKEDSDGTSR